jgi:uroporphyrinogen-III synthase
VFRQLIYTTRRKLFYLLMHTNGSLAGKTVIVTRPLAQAQNICALLEKYQAAVVHFPVISIAVAKNIGSAKIALQKLKAYSIVIFISANAVHYAMKLVQELNLSLKDKRLAAVGPATKTALEGYGYSMEFDPTAGFTSEALLSHEGLA